MKLLPHPPVSQKKKKIPASDSHSSSQHVRLVSEELMAAVAWFFLSKHQQYLCSSNTASQWPKKGGESPSKLMWTLIIPRPSGGKVSVKVTLMVCVPLHQEGPTTAWEPEIHCSVSPITNVFNVYRLYLTGLSARYCTQRCLSDSSRGPILPGLLNLYLLVQDSKVT